MRRWNAVSPIVFAFICGYHLQDLAWAIESEKGVHSFTDLFLWIVVPLSGLFAVLGAWRAFKSAAPPPASS